ncbi:MAG: hypothetical protein N3D16_00965 [Anaerolineales bacterium]|nr:hypothetical protein [Anaerolineales bacterium]
MSITQVFLLVAIAMFCGLFKNTRYRNLILIIFSLLIYYRLQPATPIRFLDFWFPTFAIALALLTWIATQNNLADSLKENWTVLLIALLTITTIAGNRYLTLCCITATRPPQIWGVILALCGFLILGFLMLSKFSFRLRLTFLAILFIGIFILFKTPEISVLLSKFLRTINQQDVRFSSANDLVWLGISYILFRMLHILLDLRANRLSALKLADILSYLFFFPSLLAGPIARFPQFQEQLQVVPHLHDYIAGLRRVFLGLFRKFVLADSLALLALSPQNAFQIHSPFYLWIALIAFSLRIYFDFSGYTDIALGSARLMGIHLPENFNAPYLKTNLIQFWNSWHITLADWFRAYVFNPLTRRLRATVFPTWLTILIPQLSTMLLIGLWHGITLNFFFWGLWHGLGLFVNNRWNNWLKTHPLNRALFIQNIFGWALTFGYVTLGWVWFLMPTFWDAWNVFWRLFGLGI